MVPAMEASEGAALEAGELRSTLMMTPSALSWGGFACSEAACLAGASLTALHYLS